MRGGGGGGGGGGSNKHCLLTFFILPSLENCRSRSWIQSVNLDMNPADHMGSGLILNSGF